MEYQVREWTYMSELYSPSCCFVAVDEINEGMKQAIVNDIRKHGYVFDETCEMSPVLNTGDCVFLDSELCEELVCRAYGFDSDTYHSYLVHALNEPAEPADREFDSESYPEPQEPIPTSFVCEYPMRQHVWVNCDGYDELKRALLSGEGNLEILPRDYVATKKGDVIRFEREDRGEYFELGVAECVRGSIALSCIGELDSVCAPDILRIVAQKDEYEYSVPARYRLEGLSGKEVCQVFADTYGTCYLSALYNYRMDECTISAVVLDSNIKFEGVLLACPQDMPAPQEVIKRLKGRYEESVRAQNEREEQRRLYLLKLKEKLNNKNKKD